MKETKEKIFSNYINSICTFKEKIVEAYYGFIDDSSDIFDINSGAFLVYNSSLNIIGLSISAVTFLEPYNDIMIINKINSIIDNNNNIDRCLEIHLPYDGLVSYYVENNKLNDILNKAKELQIDKNNFSILNFITINKDFHNINEFNLIVNKIFKPNFKQCRRSIIGKLLDHDTLNKNYDTIQKIMLNCNV